MIRWTNSGTNTGSFFGSPATGKHMLQQDLIYFVFQMAKSWSFGNNIILLIGPKPKSGSTIDNDSKTEPVLKTERQDLFNYKLIANFYRSKYYSFTKKIFLF